MLVSQVLLDAADISLSAKQQQKGEKGRGEKERVGGEREREKEHSSKLGRNSKSCILFR